MTGVEGVRAPGRTSRRSLEPPERVSEGADEELESLPAEGAWTDLQEAKRAEGGEARVDEELEAPERAAAADAEVDEALEATREPEDAAAEVDEVVEAALFEDAAPELRCLELEPSAGVGVFPEEEVKGERQLPRRRRRNMPA